jgi:threonine/homoserine/homoserine lactone efflux protein
MDVGALVTLILVAFVAQLTSATILGAIASVRAGKAVGWSYIAGLTAARLIQGLIGLGAISAIVSRFLGFLDLGRYADFLLVLGGGALLIASILSLLRGGDDEEEADESEDGALSNRGAFTWGFVATIISARQWIFTSIALTSIGQLRLGVPANIALWMGYLAASSWLAVVLLALRYLRPGSALKIIDRAAAWTHRNMHTILSALGIVVGAGLLLYGLYSLLG